jgi:hypothetical protein
VNNNKIKHLPGVLFDDMTKLGNNEIEVIDAGLLEKFATLILACSTHSLERVVTQWKKLRTKFWNFVRKLKLSGSMIGWTA